MDIKKAIKDVTATKEGVIVFQHLMRICGFTQNSVVENKITGEANVYATMYNEGRRDIYNSLRAYIPELALIEIEIKKPKSIEVKERAKKDDRRSDRNSGTDRNDDPGIGK